MTEDVSRDEPIGPTRRRRWFRWTCAAVALGFAVGSSMVLYEEFGHSTGWRARAQGIAQAEKDLAEGTAGLYEMSCVISDGVDTETGLDIRGTGYPVDATAMRAFVDGYNERVRAYIRDHGPPPNAKKPWLAVLSNLAGYWQEQCRQRPPQVIEPDGPAVDSGTCRVYLARKEMKREDHSWLQTFLVIHRPRDNKTVEVPFFFTDGATAIELQWGPPGSEFVVMRRGGEQGVLATDLRTGRDLGWAALPSVAAPSSSAPATTRSLPSSRRP